MRTTVNSSYNTMQYIETKVFFSIVLTVQTNWVHQYEIITKYVLVSASSSFEYLCYVPTAIRHISILSVRGPSLYVKIGRLQTSDSNV